MRGDADGGGVLDPCFENPFLAPDELGQLACFDTPFSTDVGLLTLTAPLSREKEGAADAGMGDAQIEPPAERLRSLGPAMGH